MSTRSALAGAATTAVLVAALGNPRAVEAGLDADHPALGLTLTGFPGWDVADLPGDVVGGVVLRLAVALVLVAVLSALAGRSRSRGAAFIGGWGALVVAAGVAGAVAYVYQVAVVLDGQTFGSTYLDGLVLAVNSGAVFGLWTGWLVGLVVALATEPAPVVTPAPAHATPSPAPPGLTARRITEPPPPWWAPTQAGEGVIRPGPTVFPPGGMPPAVPGARPVAPAGPSPTGAVSQPKNPDATHEMTTASGDPHPSDPDATPPVGIPPRDGGATEAGGTPATDDDPDPDATTATRPEDSDPTMPMPRKPD